MSRWLPSSWPGSRQRRIVRSRPAGPQPGLANVAAVLAVLLALAVLVLVVVVGDLGARATWGGYKV
ncbi:MAG: hypothetical protein ABI873_16020 [Marmoricola sp.]